MIELMIQYLKGARNRSLGLIQYLFFFLHVVMSLCKGCCFDIFKRAESKDFYRFYIKNKHFLFGLRWMAICWLWEKAKTFYSKGIDQRYFSFLFFFFLDIDLVVRLGLFHRAIWISGFYQSEVIFFWSGVWLPCRDVNALSPLCLRP